MNEAKIMVDLLKEELTCQKVEQESDRDINVKRLFDLADLHSILPIIFDRYAEKIGDFIDYQRRAVEVVKRQHIQTGEFLNIIEDMQIHDLNPIVVKGIICRSLYPRPLLRPSVDEDLLIELKDLPRYHKYLIDKGLTLDQDEADLDQAEEVSYHLANSPTYLELHTSLFPQDSDAYGDLNQIFPSVFSHITETEIDGVVLKTLEPTYHLLFLICHAYKHFLYSGFGIRQISDIMIYISNYSDSINWDYCQNALNIIRAFDFTSALLKIGIKHLGFDFEGIHGLEPFIQTDIDENPLLEDILEGGLYGVSDMSRLHSSNMTLDAVASEKHGKRKRKGLIRSLFPQYTYMKKRYPVLRKAPFLLPGAWFVRIGNYLINTRKNALSAAESVKTGYKRIELLKYYHIIK